MFLSHNRIFRTRKDHCCWACRRTILAGTGAYKYTGLEDGIYNLYYHPECREAEVKLNELHDLNWDEWIMLRENPHDDREWLEAEFPLVAARIFSSKL